MNVARAVKTPWVALTPVSTGWFVAAAVALDMVAALAIAIVGPPIVAVAVALVGVGLVWAFVLPSMLWLTQAANRLHLPGVREDVNLSLCLYALASMAVPIVLAVATGGDTLTAAVLALLTIGACLLYATLPWVLAIFMCFAPMILDHAASTRDLPGPGGPGFVAWALPTAGVLALAATWRWWRLQRQRDLVTRYPLLRPLTLGFNRSMMSLLAHPGSPTPTGYQFDARQLIRQRPDWLQPRTNLQRTGPVYPHRSLRVALGGAYLPQRWPSRCRQLLPAAGVMLIFAIIGSLALSGGWQDDRQWMTGDDAMTFLDMLVTLVVAVVPMVFTSYLHTQWRKPNAELPLLALLPGLGPATDLKRTLLQTMLRKPLMVLIALWLVLAGTSTLAHLSWPATALLLAVPLLSAGWLVASMFGMLGGGRGRALVFVLNWAGIPTLLVLAMLSAVLPSSYPAAVPWLALAWLVWAIGITAAAWPAWRAYKTRPHAFLLHSA